MTLIVDSNDVVGMG